jgi:membrane protein implicated in regulation of membrane protease activity
MQWWHWALVGLFFLGAEVATPGGLFALFFGLSGLVVAALVGLGVVRQEWLAWLLFTGVAVAALVLLRRPLRAVLDRKAVKRPVDSLVGEAAVVLEEVAEGGAGKVEVRGSSWTARTAGGSSLAKGRRCRVERIEGLTLWVRSE